MMDEQTALAQFNDQVNRLFRIHHTQLRSLQRKRNVQSLQLTQKRHNREKQRADLSLRIQILEQENERLRHLCKQEAKARQQYHKIRKQQQRMTVMNQSSTNKRKQSVGKHFNDESSAMISEGPQRATTQHDEDTQNDDNCQTPSSASAVPAQRRDTTSPHSVHNNNNNNNNNNNTHNNRIPTSIVISPEKQKPQRSLPTEKDLENHSRRANQSKNRDVVVIRLPETQVEEQWRYC